MIPTTTKPFVGPPRPVDSYAELAAREELDRMAILRRGMGVIEISPSKAPKSFPRR